MDELASRERLIRTINGEEVDRLAVYDIIHNVDFIERVTGDKITPGNAEDLTCRAVSSVLDVVRHFAVPENLEPYSYRDEDGFSYHVEWWTKAIAERPNKTARQTRDLMKRDAEKIYSAIERGEVCHQALEHCELLGERCRTFDEIKELFLRVADKLEDTVMIAPESLPGMYTATNRYGFEMAIYTYHDYPEDFLEIYQALCDYELAKIDCFADLVKVTPIALVSEAVAHNSGLLFSPEFVREVQYPRIKSHIDAWKSHGFKVIFHADGNKWPILNDVIGFGADVIDPCEPLAGMEIAKFKELYPGTTIASPIDCQHLLAFGKKEEVAAACRRAIKDSRGRRVLQGSTSEIHPAIPVENALTMYSNLRNYHCH
jgi:hypothetical protein